MAPSSRTSVRRLTAKLLYQRLLGLADQLREGRRLLAGEVGQDLAVDLDAGLLDAVHELRIGEAVLAHAGIDALDPQTAEIALLGAAVAIRILQAFFDLLDRDPVIGAGAADIALGHVDDFLVTGVRGDAALSASHVCCSSL